MAKTKSTHTIKKNKIKIARDSSNGSLSVEGRTHCYSNRDKLQFIFENAKNPEMYRKNVQKMCRMLLHCSFNPHFHSIARGRSKLIRQLSKQQILHEMKLFYEKKDCSCFSYSYMEWWCLFAEYSQYFGNDWKLFYLSYLHTNCSFPQPLLLVIAMYFA